MEQEKIMSKDTTMQQPDSPDDFSSGPLAGAPTEDDEQLDDEENEEILDDDDEE